ncbi:hypothetical protein AC578_7344 [Pseudocercospora eumusae]|uniref:Uncharacterized protein n=1 Tax=Pseudocercospora eumusae TaxID=321146 RepID=A0A139HWB7_9PEZI|nr:hypothetical protein AC578_7344 [Pseudocercospora eumusae]
MISTTTPTTEETLTLFQKIEENFPHQTLGDNKWYILLLTAITAGGHPELAAELYKHLITSKPEFSTPEQRKALTRRLREALIKLVSVVGVVKPCASFAIHLKPEIPVPDTDISTSRSDILYSWD